MKARQLLRGFVLIAFGVFTISFILRTCEIENKAASGALISSSPSATAGKTTPKPQPTEFIEINDITPVALSVKIEVPTPTPKPAEKPRVLIYHTHTYEAYTKEKEDEYENANGASWRTKDPQYNLIAVGNELKKALEDLGMEVIHDTTEFEPPKLGTAYMRSLEMLEERMENGEEYDLIIDMHRDAYLKRSWTPADILVGGESCARIMLLMGTGEAGFSEKPDWEKNCALAQSIIDELNMIKDGLAKDMNLKDQRYNQHVSEKCVLIEVGHNENTLSQAKASMKYLALAINRVLQE